MKKVSVSLVTASLCMILFAAGCGNTATPSSAPTNMSPASTSTGGNAPAGDKIVLRLGHTLSQENHYQSTALAFAKSVKEKTGGKVEIQVYPSSQLGSDLQQMQSLQTGTQDLEITPSATVSNVIKEWSIFDLPYLFDNIDQGNKVLQGAVGKKFLDMLTSNQLVGLSFIAIQERDVFSKKAVKTLDDIKGAKLRVLQSPGYINGYKALGANPTPMAYSEVFSALQQGVIDGGDVSPDQFVQDHFTDVAKNFSLTHVNHIPVVLLAGKTKWDSLSPEYQKALQEAAAEASKVDIETYKKAYDDAINTMKQKGVAVHSMDTKPWIEVTDAARNDLLSKIQNGQDLYKQITDAKSGK